MDEIIITGIACMGYHGCLPEERIKGQPFIVDLALRLDLKDAGLTDDLQRTVDYSEVCKTVVAIVEGKPFNLIEALAYAIGDRLLEQFFLLVSVAVTVHKPEAPIGCSFTDVAVRAERFGHE